MKKITLILGMFFTSILSFGQVCEQTFTVDGTDNDAVLSIQNSQLDCNMGTITSIAIAEAYLGFFCGDWYSFSIDIDGVVTDDVCAEDLEQMDITNFSTITITASNIDEYEDDISIELTIAVSYTATEIPNCDAVLISPVDGSADNNLLGNLEWSPATGAVAGYKLSVGTTTGGTDIINMQDLGNVTTFDIPGMLAQGTQYFVNIVSYNSLGDAIGCTEYNFETATLIEGTLCENAIEITGLPFNAQDDTDNYADLYYEGIPGTSGCGSSNNYLNGNDVVYSYTATFDGLINITLTPDENNTYAGIFIYNSCENIGVECIGGAANGTDDIREILEFPVVNGQTYYFVISTWASPQTVSYTLDISENTCTNATATYSVVPDCTNGDQFLVAVDVSDLGTATSLSVSDDAGSDIQTLSEIGTLTFGPYDNNVPVVITIANDQDSSCVINSEALTQTICPPANDTCMTAFDLTNEVSPITGTTVAATNANTATCNSSGTEVENTHGDVFYSILVPSGSTLSMGQTLNDYDSSNVIFYGDCDNRTIIDCFDDPDYKTVEWSNDTGMDQTVYWIQDAYNGAGTFTLEWSVIDCVPFEATYTVVSDCANGDQFLVEVNVTNLGSATSLSVYDDFGSEGQTATQTGILTFGPYDNQTEVIFTIENNQNSDCSISSSELTQNACPPANDDCSNAVALITGGDFETNPVVGTNMGATASQIANTTIPAPTCGSYSGGDVWYSIVVPASGNITVETNSNEGGLIMDTVMQVYSGTCEALVNVECDDDDSDDGLFSKISLVDRTPGELLYVRVFEYGNDVFGTFKIAAYDASLSNDAFEKNTFTIYPNPVKNVLNISFTQNISEVSVYNMLGQQVTFKVLNTNKGQVDMSNLASGTYLVKVKADNAIQTIKVVKE